MAELVHSYDCHCGQQFRSGALLIAHYVEAHRTGGDHDDQCPVCYRPIVSANMRRHLEQVHSMELPALPRGRRSTAVPAAAERIATSVRSQRTSRPRQSSVVNPVDGMVTAVLMYLFPKGMIPLTALEPLSRWREATEKFLQEVSDGG